MTESIPSVRKRIFLEPIHPNEDIHELMNLVQNYVPEAVLHNLPLPIGPLIEIPSDTDSTDLMVLKLCDIGKQKPKKIPK